MFKPVFIIITTVTLFACGATQAPPYQKDRAPENRDQYSSAEGMTQYQKDQNYLMNKELTEKCNNAKVDLAVAESQQNEQEAARQRDIIDNSCKDN